MRAPRTNFGHLIWLVSGLMVALAPAAQASPAADDPRTQALREALAQQIPSEGIRISVVMREPDAGISRAQRRETIRARRERVLARLNRGFFSVGHRYQWLSGFSGWADVRAIESLVLDAEVVSIDIDRIAYAALAQGRVLVGADIAEALGVTGSGVTVAVIDSGIDTDHPDLSSSLIAEACFCDDAIGAFGCCPNGKDTQTGTGAAEDDYGHGTGVCGVIVSSSVSNPGVATDASIAAIKVLGANGSGNFSDIASGLDWVISNRVTYGIKIVNLSVSDSGQYDNATVSPCTGSNTANAIVQLKGLGVSVFAASGNNGHDNGISFPACVPAAFSVGGVYDATFSSVNWGACSDVPAPVDSFVCHTNSGSLLDILAPSYRATIPAIGGGTQNIGGTSIASPYAVGQAALLLDADASLTPDQILSSLEIGAPLVTNPDNGLSFPRTRVDLAVAQILGVCGNGILEAGEACDDGNTIPGDCCDGICQIEAMGSSCDDADVCTDGDICVGAICTSGPVLDCDDLNECTADGCDEVTGCFHEAIEGCEPPLVPGLSPSGLLLLVGFMFATALWAFRIREHG